jgi:hypothetical protein
VSELNATGLAVVTSMFDTLATHGPKAAKAVRARHCVKYRARHVDDAARSWMRERQAEFNTVVLWIELKNWASENYPIRPLWPLSPSLSEPPLDPA